MKSNGQWPDDKVSWNLYFWLLLNWKKNNILVCLLRAFIYYLYFYKAVYVVKTMMYIVIFKSIVRLFSVFGKIGRIVLVLDIQPLTPRPESLGPNVFTVCDMWVAEPSPMTRSNHLRLIGWALCRWRDKLGGQNRVTLVHPPSMPSIGCNPFVTKVYHQSAVTQALP